ncbi:MAG: argininosuccinate synthase [Candidatus Omnitrophica bacterium]|nr:argininosuccinate synthase [Candidatus Omnitrophota bacterium]MBU4478553.1 argininosuccinate synthase [Candidatus Omnitrophota bacterium]
MKKVVLAYSGGLDTSCCVKWLQDKGFEVICFSADLGSEFSPQELRKKARAGGVARIYVEDLREEFARDYILPSLKANAVYESKYVLSTALGRPLIAKYLVDIAHKEQAEYVAHGCTGKGNDQVRIDTTVKILGPKLKIIAPVREWELTSRESEIEYARNKNIPISATKDKIYSIDQNIWGISIEGGMMEDLNNAPDEAAYVLTKHIDKTPDKADYAELEFEQGVPVKVNGKKKKFLAIIELLNELGGKHCIGRTDLVEDRTVGIKSREVYEAPAAWILIRAHQELESVVLDKDTLGFKEIAGLKYAQLVYQGLWFSRLRRSLDAFMLLTQEKVTGTIKLKLYKGNISVVSRKSQYSLYKKDLATYGEKDQFNREDAKGFIEIFSLPYRER